MKNHLKLLCILACTSLCAVAATASVASVGIDEPLCRAGSATGKTDSGFSAPSFVDSPTTLPPTGGAPLYTACYISAEKLTRELNEQTLLVDLREPQAYASARVPGSINMPGESLKSRPYLANKKIVLLDAGYAYSNSDPLCKALRDKGFSQLYILKGGLDAWHTTIGPLRGDPIVSHPIDSINAAQFMREIRFDHWRILDVSEAPWRDHPSGSQQPHRIDHQPELVTRQQTVGTYLSQFGPPQPDQLTLVVSDRPDDYAMIRQAAKALNWKNVYYLEGGLAASRKYLANNRAMHHYTPGKASAPRSCRAPG